MTTHSLSYADTDLRRAPARLFPLADDVTGGLFLGYHRIYCRVIGIDLRHGTETGI